MKNSIMHTNRGITLLETLITVAILTIIVISVTTFIVQSYRADLFANEQVEAIRNAQRGVDVMVKEIRESSPAENGAYPVETATDQTVIFYSDTDADELIERIRYTLDGTNLIRGVTKPSGWPATYNNPETTTVLSRYVRNGVLPTFYYYNGDYPTDTVNNPLPTPVAVQDIRLIRVYLQINVDPNRAPDSFILISNSQLRNVKDNL